MKTEYTPTQTCKLHKNIKNCQGKKKDKSYDCTDCKHFSNCYLRRKRSRENDPAHLEICKDFEIDEFIN